MAHISEKSAPVSNAASGLCLDCRALPVNPGHKQCPSCYAASKPLCQQCQQRPTNPGYAMCQPCFAATKKDNKAPAKENNGAQSRRQQQKQQQQNREQKRPQRTQPKANVGPFWAPEQSPSPAYPWQRPVHSPQLGGTFTPMAHHPAPFQPHPHQPIQVIHPSQMPFFQLQLQASFQPAFQVPYFQPRTPTPPTPQRCPSPGSDTSNDLSPCASLSSTSPEPPRPSASPFGFVPLSMPCVVCKRAAARRGSCCCADCYENGSPTTEAPALDADDAELAAEMTALRVAGPSSCQTCGARPSNPGYSQCQGCYSKTRPKGGRCTTPHSAPTSAVPGIWGPVGQAVTAPRVF